MNTNKAFLETNDPNLDIDSIMDCVRSELSLAEYVENTLKMKLVNLGNCNFKYFDLNEQILNKEDTGNRFHINELLQYNGVTFIRNAFIAILKREPFDSEASEFLEYLGHRKLGKIYIIWKLRHNEEGEKIGVDIKNLQRHHILRKMYMLPIIGRLFRAITATIQLPTVMENLIQFQQHVHKELYDIQDKQNNNLKALIDRCKSDINTSLKLIGRLHAIEKGSELKNQRGAHASNMYRDVISLINRINLRISALETESKHEKKVELTPGNNRISDPA